MSNVYRGWNIYFDQNYQIWNARQVGVSMNHKDRESLLKMVDQHILDKTQWFSRKEDEGGVTIS